MAELGLEVSPGETEAQNTPDSTLMQLQYQVVIRALGVRWLRHSSLPSPPSLELSQALNELMCIKYSATWSTYPAINKYQPLLLSLLLLS